MRVGGGRDRPVTEGMEHRAGEGKKEQEKGAGSIEHGKGTG